MLAELGLAAGRAGPGRHGQVRHQSGQGLRLVDTGGCGPSPSGWRRELGRRNPARHTLALELWQTGIHEAQLLACFVDLPEMVTEEQAEAWVVDLDSWDTCDQLCNSLLGETPFAWDKALEWSGREEEFVKRAGFALMAVLAWHAKDASDERFLPHAGRHRARGRRRAHLRQEGGQLGAPQHRQAERRPARAGGGARPRRIAASGSQGRPLGGRRRPEGAGGRGRQAPSGL